MKKFVLTLSLVLCGYTLSQASILTKSGLELSVGSNPVSIIEDPNNGVINIFCAGIDANDNNVYDEAEDEKPTWWTYDPAGDEATAAKVKEFDNFLSVPFKPSVLNNAGTTVFGIPFKCNTNGDEFTGTGKFEVYQAGSYTPILTPTIPASEYLYVAYGQDKVISITRKNGDDLFSILKQGTTTVDEFPLGGNANDFAFADFDGDGIDEVAILVDNSRLELFSIKDSIVLLGTADFVPDPEYTGEFASLYSYGGYVYTLFKGSNKPVTVTFDESSKNAVIGFPELDGASKDAAFFYPVNGNTTILNQGFDINLMIDNELTEVHRTPVLTNFVYANDNNLYLTGNKKVLIYSITNELNRDASFVGQSFVGEQPLDLFNYHDALYTVNLGVDFNFNNVKDLKEGDQKASISKIEFLDPMGNLSLKSEKKFDFDFPINFPLNTNLSPDADIVIPSGNMVYYYNVEDNTVYDSLDAGAYVSCAFRVLDYLVLGLRDAKDGKSYVRIIKGDFIDVSTEVGKNVVDLAVYQNSAGFGVISLSEGTFGQADATVNIIKLSTMGIGENISIEVGKTGSGISLNADQTKAIITMNGSHEIHIIDLLTSKKIATFSTGTSAYGGPRTTMAADDWIYITTYSNQVIILDAVTGKKITSLALDGNSEGLYLSDKYLFATNINYSNYAPNNRVIAYQLDKITDVPTAPTPSLEAIRVYPNPVINDFHLVSDDLAGMSNIVIINSAGKVVAKHSAYSDGAIALNADALGLAAGRYIAIVNGNRAVRFVVIK